MLTQRTILDLTEAQTILQNLPIQTHTVRRSVATSNGYTLAESIHAPFPYPAFRRSGYDGYAINRTAEQIFPEKFEIIAEVPAGATYVNPLQANQAVRIMTGAAVPDDANQVVMLEDTKPLVDNYIEITTAPAHSNITPIGSEFQAGDLLLSEGTLLNPGAIGLLSAFGIQDCLCYEKARVAVLSTGTEVSDLTAPNLPGKIYNSNAPMLQNLLIENQAYVTQMAHIADDYQLLCKTIDKMLEDADIVITTGGVSVGDFDFLAVATNESDQLLFNKISMRPGSPTTAFLRDGKLVIALSGNPSACFTGFYLLAEPLLKRYIGQPSGLTRKTMTLAHDYKKSNNFDKYLRGTYTEKAGQLNVSLVGSDKSSALGNLHLATCLFKIPHGTVSTPKGTEVETWLLPCR